MHTPEEWRSRITRRPAGTIVRASVAALTVAMMVAMMVACGKGGDAGGGDAGRIADARGRAASGNGDYAAGTADANRVMASLTLAPTPGAEYRVVRDTAQLHGGTIVGRVEVLHPFVGDAAVLPTHNTNVCRPFTETVIPSLNAGVGNAIVWLVGVTQGPPQNTPRRVTLTLDRCRLEPRVQIVAMGSTIQVKSRDAMMAKLRFTDIGATGRPRARVDFNDAGQVVPTAAVSVLPGVVEIRDDLHPWVRAYVAVTPHPYVAVTAANGEFRFDAVPPGMYTLVIWQEALGVRTRVLRITSGVETRLVVEYDKD